MYVKHLELTRFKSFGSSTGIPLLPGFTVVSGPNGSGKSNLLDALLFALGLSSSRGMRAEKLLDLVNSASLGQGKKRLETAVSVTFALGSQQDWKVSRRLRVSHSDRGEPTTTSTFYINDVPCSLSELHEQLEAMHIYPNGYNVVLQGDVTSIISMNAKERRQIIDELAGVANFDRKIAQSHTKLEGVREQIERFKLIEHEWHEQSQRLWQESQKALQYQQLREQKQILELHQNILTWQHLEGQLAKAETAIQLAAADQERLAVAINQVTQQLAGAETQLATLQHQIHELGESDYLHLKSQALVVQAHVQQLDQNVQTWQEESAHLTQQHQHAEQVLATAATTRAALEAQQATLVEAKHQADLQYQQQQAVLQERRERLQVLAQSADNWIQQHQYFTRQIQETRRDLEPLHQEHIRLTTHHQSLTQQLLTINQECESLVQALAADHPGQAILEHDIAAGIPLIQSLAQQLADIQAQLALDQTTAKRLQNELFQQQRQLDKLETRQQVLQDNQGSRAAQMILNGGLVGICGLVAQLGQVDPRYQLALEIAAGNRLNFMVVEDSITAELAIDMLKRERAGRLTFLPLDTIQPARMLTPVRLSGLVDYAVRLVTYEDHYRDIFAFVFGQTLVFETMTAARPHMGKHRMVTIEGELLETSGAMTGGSLNTQSSVHFSASANQEIQAHKQRVHDLERMLVQLHSTIQQQQDQEQILSQRLMTQRQTLQQQQTEQQQRQRETHQQQERLHQRQAQQHEWQTTADRTMHRLTEIDQQLPTLHSRLEDLTQKLQQLEQSSLNQYWQQAQQAVQDQEQVLTTALSTVRELEQQIQHIQTQQQLHTQHLQQTQIRCHEWQVRQQQLQDNLTAAHAQRQQFQQELQEWHTRMEALDSRLGSLRQHRDHQEFQVREQQQIHQRLEWDQYQAQQQQQEKELLVTQLRPQVSAARSQLPADLPLLPETLTLDDLQRQTRRLDDKLRALEPVNMLAISEYESVQERLADLRQKLETLEQERTALLLRIENFATLRRQAFLEAFQAVDGHFRTIFAQLSDGDGYLNLENPEDPLAGGLSLVAHPKGKPVRHLASMSGGEKSLTALSFIFALQRFRPSSFYAFDEVDMFLDGANVEKLANMIEQQSQQAQFIVVSLRRPMIEKAQRTIGVTQARGATTQVIGLSLKP